MKKSMLSLFPLVLAVSLGNAQDCGGCPVTGKTAQVAKKADACQDEAKKACGSTATLVVKDGPQDAKKSCCETKVADAAAKGEKKACCEAKLAKKVQDEKAGKAPAKDCCDAKTATTVAKQDAKKDCCKKCDAPAKTVAAYPAVGTFTPCDTMVAYLDAKKLADGGCKCSTEKLAALEKATPGLGKMVKLYEDARAGCPQSKATLDAMVAKWHEAEAAQAKTVAFQPCDQMKAFMKLEDAAAKGCETSKTQLAALTKKSPALADVVATYRAAEKGCEKSKAKLAKLVADMQAKTGACDAKSGSCDAKTVSEGACSGASCDDAKTVAFQPCDQMKAFMKLEDAAAKGCETSKAKLAAMTKESPCLADVVATYRAAEKGCEKSKAKLAKFVSDMQKQAKTDGACESGSCGDAKSVSTTGSCDGKPASSCGSKPVSAEGSCDAKPVTTGSCDGKTAGSCGTKVVKQL